MKLDVKQGTYVVAVSGGVDSMSLLRMLTADQANSKNRYVVAHFNHGIRQDSKKEQVLVQSVAGRLGLPVEIGQGKLGPSASEDQARRARYAFLKKVQKKHNAAKVITAHHQDDAIETAVLNILRGTGPRGLSSIYDNPNIERPLLGVTKQDILDYAIKQKVVWIEDESNHSNQYARNFVRREIVPRLPDEDKKKLANSIYTTKRLNEEIKNNIAKISQYIIKDNKINRYEYNMLPSVVSREVLLFWLRKNKTTQLSRPEVEKADNFIRVSKNNTRYPLAGGHQLAVNSTGNSIEVILR